jgi:AcrR family transcriptional regulator
MSSRAAATRQGLLDAAAEVFAAVGYHDASVADIVLKAGASVGSLYHHFGGKADLYTALFSAYQDRQEARAAAAVAAARREGTTDAGDLFAVGARAYLRGCWEERDMSRLFHAGEGPPGWLVVYRENRRTWIGQNQQLLKVTDDELGESLVVVVTAVLAEAGHEVALADHEDTAYALVEEMTSVVRRVIGA